MKIRNKEFSNKGNPAMSFRFGDTAVRFCPEERPEVFLVLVPGG